MLRKNSVVSEVVAISKPKCFGLGFQGIWFGLLGASFCLRAPQSPLTLDVSTCPGISPMVMLMCQSFGLLTPSFSLQGNSVKFFQNKNGKGQKNVSNLIFALQMWIFEDIFFKNCDLFLR